MVIAGASPRSSRGESGIRVRIPASGTGSQPLQPVPPFRSMLNQVEAPVLPAYSRLQEESKPASTKFVPIDCRE